MQLPFVVIEGIDGSGKTTLRDNLSKYLSNQKIPHIVTSEPTNGEIGKIIRQKLVSTKENPAIDALLFAADRVWHWENKIEPALKEGILVISDRYKISSLAYQSCQGLDIEWIKIINSKVPDPPYMLYLDVDPEIAFERIKDKQHKEKFETPEYLVKLKNCYENALRHVNTKVFHIDAEKSVEEVLSQSIEILIKEQIILSL